MKQHVLTLLLFLLTIVAIQPHVQAAEQKSYSDVTYKIITLKNGAREVHITGAVKMKNHIVIPEKIEGLPVTEIIDRAFYVNRLDYALDGTYDEKDIRGYSDLFITTVTLPNTLKRIGNEAFLNHHISKITLPSGLQEIGYAAFALNRLTSITIPKSVQKIGGNIVQNNPIKTYALPAQFNKPKNKAFGQLLYVTFTRNSKQEVRITGHTYKTTQTKVTIPATINKMPVTEIDDYAFTSTSSLLGLQMDKPLINSIALPATIRKIGDHALSGVRFENNNPDFSLPRDLEVIGDYAFAHNTSTNKGKELKLPTKLKSIGNGAFQWNQFQSVTIPFSVKTIGKYAFEYNDLKKVTIGGGVTTIPVGAFRGNHISSLTLPKNLVSIESQAFLSNSLPRLILPSTVETIGDFAFSHNQLTEVTLSKNVKTIGDGAFIQNQLTTFDVPTRVKEFPFNAVIINPLQTIKLKGSATKMVKYNATYTWDKTQSYAVDGAYTLYTDKQFKNAWTKWNQTITRPTTFYVKQHGQ